MPAGISFSWITLLGPFSKLIMELKHAYMQRLGKFEKGHHMQVIPWFFCSNIF